MWTPAHYQARFAWKPATVRPPGKVVRVDELQPCTESAEMCPPEETFNYIVPSSSAVAAVVGSGDIPEVMIRPPGRIVRVDGEQSSTTGNAAADDHAPVPSVANCPGHDGCMCCLLLKIEERLSHSTAVLNQLYATLLPLRAQQQLQLDMVYDEEDFEDLESVDSVYGSSEEDLERTDDSLNSDVSAEDYLSR